MEIESSIPWFRQLYYSLLEWQGEGLYESVLLPWVEKAQVAVSHFSRFKTASSCETTEDDFLVPNWNLYALSRVSDHLLLPFQNDERGRWAGPSLTKEQYVAFFTALGFRPFASGAFSSFHHEVVRVHQSSDPALPIAVTATFWPGLMFGDLLFSRSGVEVVGGSNHISEESAETSTLYFTHRRLHRRTEDLSMGWGSNSQWRTRFRRDYQHAGRLIYNLDGKRSLNVPLAAGEDRDGLKLHDRIELCKNRCFLHCGKEHADLWPYDDRSEDDTNGADS